MRIIFVTGNQRKLSEAREACEPLGIEIDQVKFEINEIQHHNPIIISKQKAAEAYDILKKPIVINDASWKIPALNGFPGGYMKDINKWFDSKDFIALLSSKKDKSVCCVETVIYKDAKIEKIFHKDYWGEFSMTPRGTGNAIEQVAMFGGKTIGEKRDSGNFAFNTQDYIWYEFAQWYVNHKHSS